MVENHDTNGINVKQLRETINLIRNKPDLARFIFRATNQWINGAHNRATVKGFFGAGAEDDSRSPMNYEIDEPPVLLGTDEGANPVEYLLVALSGCLTTSLIVNAAARGVEIKSLKTALEGALDLRGFLAIDPEVAVGYEKIRVLFDIDADISMEQKRELVQLAAKYSPVYNTISKAVPVSVEAGSDLYS